MRIAARRLQLSQGIVHLAASQHQVAPGNDHAAGVVQLDRRCHIDILRGSNTAMIVEQLARFHAHIAIRLDLAAAVVQARAGQHC
ncbi:hypothetical protein D3C85_367980 [compost metagenome]